MISRYSLPEMENIWSEQNKFQKMLDVELAICEAWNQIGRIPDDCLAEILSKATFQVQRIEEIEATTHHDVIAFVSNVSENIGANGRFIHMGATSSDILDTGLALQMVESTKLIKRDLQKFSEILKRKALTYENQLTIGRTHGIHAEPTSFGLKFALWYSQNQQNIKRLDQMIQEVSFGKLSGAVGNYANTDPQIEEIVLRKLSLKPSPVSTQIIQRDTHAVYLTTFAIIGGCLEQIATEIRHLQRTEVREAQEPFGKGQKGSSAMPHKKNPILSERVCGMARILRGYSMSALENIALWHERDISHSSVERIILPDGSILLDYMISIISKVVDGLVVYPEQMEANVGITKGSFFSQKVLTELIENGFSREEAYSLIQEAAFTSFTQQREFREVLEENPIIKANISSEKMNEMFDIRWFLRFVDFIYRRVGIKKI
jgi:adenylosuccinate lyase